MKHETKVYIAGGTALLAMAAFFFTVAMMAQGTDTTASNIIMVISGIILAGCVIALNTQEGEE